MKLDAEHGEFPSEMIRLRLIVWGVTVADQEHAIYRAGLGSSRVAWEFVSTERHCGTTCPIDIRNPDPRSIAVDRDYHWAYVVYSAGCAR
jgi:hypothetical protein